MLKIIRDNFGFAGHDDCSENVSENATTSATDEQNPSKTNDGRVDVEVLGEPAANASDAFAIFDTIKAFSHVCSFPQYRN